MHATVRLRIEPRNLEEIVLELYRQMHSKDHRPGRRPIYWGIQGLDASSQARAVAALVSNGLLRKYDKDSDEISEYGLAAAEHRLKMQSSFVHRRAENFPLFSMDGKTAKNQERLHGKDYEESGYEVSDEDIVFGANLEFSTDYLEDELEFAYFRSQLLLRLLEEDPVFSPDKWRNLLEVANDQDLRYKSGWVAQAGHELWKLKLIDFEVSVDHGLDDHVLARLSDSYDEILRNLGVFSDHENGGATFADLVPASDRIVSLDHNSRDYRAAIEALDRVVDEVRRSNEYAAWNLGDRDRRLADLSAGSALLGEKRVSSNRVRWILGATLMFLAEEFAGAPIGEAAQYAWTQLKSLMGF
ncbi:MAG: hypothetical protein WD044_17470 [Dongiaceae bacterium]